MSRSFKNACHSFVNTLVYIWTFFRALFIRKATPSSLPPDQLTLVPYPTDIDLEGGRGLVQDVGIPEGHIGTRFSMSHIIAVRKALTEDARRQASLRDSPGFSSSPQTPQKMGESRPTEASDANESASERPGGNSPLPMGDACGDESVDISSAYSHNTSPTTEGPCVSDILAVSDLVQAPANISLCSDVFIESPSKFNAFKFGGYPLSSTPPKTPKNRRGHRRAPLATITNITHVASLFSPPDVPSPPKGGSISGAPIVQRTRSQSLRRKPAFDDLHSPSPMRRYSQASLGDYGASPTKRPVSIVWFSDKNGIPFKSVSPLRIVKRNVQPPSTPDAQPKAVPAQVTEENLRDMVAAVRNLREEEHDEEGAAARELINRASVWTCKTAVTVDTNRNTLSTQEEETDEEEYGDQATCRSTCSPPPPYAFSNPGFHQVAKKAHEIADTPCGTRVKPPCGPPTSDSTELSYLQDGSPLSSTESSLNDILTSFEGLISNMSRRSSIPKTPTRTEEKVDAVSNKEVPCDIREREMKFHVHPYGGITDDEGVEGCGGPHWSEVLLLEGYTI